MVKKIVSDVFEGFSVKKYDNLYQSSSPNWMSDSPYLSSLDLPIG
jgi:hypothetical protein